MKANHILLLLALAVATSADAAMYKWKDAQGNVHYTETPPPQGDAKEIAPPPRISAPAASGSSSLKNEQDSEGDNEHPDKKGQAKISPEEQEANRRNCEAAKANLQIYQTKGRIKNPDGEIVELNDEVRQQKIQQTEEQIKKFCK